MTVCLKVRSLLLMAIIALLYGCAGSPPRLDPTLTSTVGASQAAPTPTMQPDSTDTAPAAQESTPSPQDTPASDRRPPSGWTVFTNPDFVQGVTLNGDQLWAATLGGVVAWDLETRAPTLYSTRDGLAEVQGNDIVYCPLPVERILVAHPSGVLSAFDLELKRWSRIPITFEDGSTLTGVRTLLCDSPNQRLMVGASNGLGILNMKTGEWKHFGSAEGLTSSTIYAIDVVGQAIWLAAGEDAAFMIMGSTVFPFNNSSGFPSGGVRDLSVDSDQSIWFGYTTGLVHYQDKKWNSYGSQTPSGIPFLSVDHVVVSTEHIWIASSEEGICPFNRVSLYCATVYPGTRGTAITDLVVDQNGVAYASTSGGGVVVMNGEELYRLRLDWQQLMSNDVQDIVSSPDGMLWVATDQGVNILNPYRTDDPWQTILPQRNQLAYPRVTGLLSGGKGVWLFYNQEPGASFFDGETWLQLDSRKGLSGIVLDAEVDQRGYVWFATEQGINVWDGSVLRANTPPNNLPNNLPGNVFHALFNVGDVMWVGSDRGLYRYEQYEWELVLPEITVNAIALDGDGGLLVGTDLGLVRYDGEQSYLWLINLGEELISSPKVTSITQDGLGQLWVGTAEDGLLHYDGKKWEQFSTSSGLPSNHIRKLFTDPLGAVWIVAPTGGGGGGLARFVP